MRTAKRIKNLTAVLALRSFGRIRSLRMTNMELFERLALYK